MKQSINRQTVIELHASGLNASKIARELDVGETSIYNILKEHREKNTVKEPKFKGTIERVLPQQITATIKNGQVLVTSDEHVRPGVTSIACQGALNLLKKEKFAMVVSNGDFMDLASISVHDADGFEKRYTVAEELAAGMEFLAEIQSLSKNAEHVLIQGNHDCRFNKFLAKHAPQYKGVPGMDIHDHLPKGWKYAMSMLLNKNTMFLHAITGGVHAAYNNAYKSGMSVITGHTHKLDVKAITDYNGTRYGVQTGTLADIKSNPLFNYTHASPLDWIAGFVVLTYIDGELQYPEVASVNKQGQVIFRGKVIA